MLIRVSAAGAVLESPEDLKRFKLVAAQGLEGEALQQALGGAARLEGEHAWVSPEWIREASGLANDAAWQDGFLHMLSFAGRHGWVNDAGEVRAHIERG